MSGQGRGVAVLAPCLCFLRDPEAQTWAGAPV